LFRRLSPFPFAALPVVASDAAPDHFVAPLIARHDEGSSLIAPVLFKGFALQFKFVSRLARREGAMQKTHDALVKLALFCANQARTSTMKDAAREAWRLAVEYRDQAATLGEPPDIGKKPPHVDEA
jgi:hypothetical protein